MYGTPHNPSSWQCACRWREKITAGHRLLTSRHLPDCRGGGGMVPSQSSLHVHDLSTSKQRMTLASSCLMALVAEGVPAVLACQPCCQGWPHLPEAAQHHSCVLPACSASAQLLQARHQCCQPPAALHAPQRRCQLIPAAAAAERAAALPLLVVPQDQNQPACCWHRPATCSNRAISEPLSLQTTTFTCCTPHQADSRQDAGQVAGATKRPIATGTIEWHT